MSLVDVVPAAGVDRAEALRLVGALEHASEHPVAQAIAAAAGDAAGAGELPQPRGPGRRGRRGGRRSSPAGPPCSRTGASRCQTSSPPRRRGPSATVRRRSQRRGRCARALFIVADTIKPTSAEAIRRLGELGLRPVLLTGDNAATAWAVATEVGIDEVGRGAAGGEGRGRAPPSGGGTCRRDGRRRSQRCARARAGGSRPRDRHGHGCCDRGERPDADVRRPARRRRRDPPLLSHPGDDQGQPLLGLRLQRGGDPAGRGRPAQPADRRRCNGVLESLRRLELAPPAPLPGRSPTRRLARCPRAPAGAEPDGLAPSRERPVRGREPAAGRVVPAPDRRHRRGAQRARRGGGARPRPRVAGDLGDEGPVRQSDRRERHLEAAETLGDRFDGITSCERTARPPTTSRVVVDHGRGPRPGGARLRPSAERGAPPLSHEVSGSRAPDYVHHGLVLGPDGKKLSKRRHGVATIADVREQESRPAVRAYLEELGLPKHDVHLDLARLRRLAIDAIESLPDEELAARAGAPVELARALRARAISSRHASWRVRSSSRPRWSCPTRPCPRSSASRSCVPAARREGDRARAKGGRRRPEGAPPRASPERRAVPSSGR